MHQLDRDLDVFEGLYGRVMATVLAPWEPWPPNTEKVSLKINLKSDLFNAIFRLISNSYIQ